MANSTIRRRQPSISNKGLPQSCRTSYWWCSFKLHHHYPLRLLLPLVSAKCPRTVSTKAAAVAPAPATRVPISTEAHRPVEGKIAHAPREHHERFALKVLRGHRAPAFQPILCRHNQEGGGSDQVEFHLNGDFRRNCPTIQRGWLKTILLHSINCFPIHL